MVYALHLIFVLYIASLSSFESKAILMELSLLTVMTTGLIKNSSEHFSNLIICLSSINFFSSFSTLSIRCIGTLLPLCCVGLKYCLNVDLAIWFFDFPKRLHRWGKFLKILFVIFGCSVLMKFVIFSPFFVCDSCISSFWSISLPSRFTVLCGTTSISQFGAAVFPDDKLMLRVLFFYFVVVEASEFSHFCGVVFDVFSKFVCQPVCCCL